MPNITQISFLGGYTNKEDQVTSAFLHILHLGGEKLFHKFLSLKDITIPTFFNITSQFVNNKKGRPDGAITCSQNIFFESKITKSAIKENDEQLIRHCAQLENDNDLLIYITPHTTKPKSLDVDKRILWYNWKEVCDFFIFYSKNESEIFQFVCAEFEKLLENINVIDHFENRVLIVGGRMGEPRALKYNVYICQANRPFLPSEYLAFYTNKKISYVFKILKVFQNVDITTCEDIPLNYFSDIEPNYLQTDLRTVFILDKPQQIDILCDKKDKSGNLCAFLQFQRYTTYEKIIKAKKTSQL